MQLKGHEIAHVTLTVHDIGRTKEFYEKLFRTDLPMDDEKSFSLLKVGIPCWFTQWEKQYPNDHFDEKRVGLDHLAFKLETLEELNEVISQIQKMEVKTVGLQRYDNKYPYVAFRDPDNIQTEFFINEEM